jgi:WD40 repeat protein
MKILRGHVGDVDAVAFSPDGKLLASGSSDGTGRLWKATGDYDYIGPLVGHTGLITAVAFNSRSDLVATASTDWTVRVWKIGLGLLPLVLRGHRGAVTRLRFSEDGKRAITVGRDGKERTWDPEPEPWMHLLSSPGPRLRPKRVAYAPGKRATIQGDKVVVQDLATGDTTPLVGHFNAVNAVDFSPDGRWIVTAGPIAGGLWRSNSGRIYTYLRNTDRPVAARFTSNTRIVTLARDGKTRSFRFSVRMFTAAELRDWLLAAGFREADPFGEDGEPLTLEHRRMTLVARK